MGSIWRLLTVETAEGACPRSNNLLPRLFAAATSILFALLLLFVLLWALDPRVVAPPSVCSSEACISASAMLLRSIDRSADPCDDFFSFACGGIDSNYKFTDATMLKSLGAIPDERSKLEGKLFELFIRPELVRSHDPEMSRLHQAARDMFLSCVAWHDPGTWWLPSELKTSPQRAARPRDLAVLQQALIREIDAPTDLEGFLAMLVRTGTSGLIQLVHKEAIIALSQHVEQGPYLGLSVARFGMRPWISGTFRSELSELCNLLGINLTVSIDQLIKTQMNYWIPPNGQAVTFSLPQLQALTDEQLLSSSFSFNWSRFIRNLHVHDSFRYSNGTIIISNLDELIQVLQRLAPELAARKGALFDFLRVDAAMSLRNFLPYENFTNLINSYSQSKYLIGRSEGSTKSEHVAKFCMGMPLASMTPVVYDMFKLAYVRDNFSLIQSLITDIQDAMKLNVNEEHWIMEPSKTAIIDKINDIKSAVAYFELPSSTIKSMFNHALKLMKGHQDCNFGEMVLQYKEADTRLQLWFQTSGKQLYNAYNAISNPFAVNAYYKPGLNSINILTGILGTFLYNSGYPEYLLNGGIGSVIGHEIAHAFGPSFLPKQLDNATAAAYSDRQQCLIQFYGKQKFAGFVTVNSEATVNDDFSDIVGTNAAFRAYKNRLARSGRPPELLPGPLGSALTPDQLFFVQAAQFHCQKMNIRVLLGYLLPGVSHSPPKSRVRGSVMHSKKFASVFRCRPGSKMLLGDDAKCSFW